MGRLERNTKDLPRSLEARSYALRCGVEVGDLDVRSQPDAGVLDEIEDPLHRRGDGDPVRPRQCLGGHCPGCFRDRFFPGLDQALDIGHHASEVVIGPAGKESLNRHPYQGSIDIQMLFNGQLSAVVDRFQGKREDRSHGRLGHDALVRNHISVLVGYGHGNAPHLGRPPCGRTRTTRFDVQVCNFALPGHGGHPVCRITQEGVDLVHRGVDRGAVNDVLGHFYVSSRAGAFSRHLLVQVHPRGWHQTRGIGPGGPSAWFDDGCLPGNPSSRRLEGLIRVDSATLGSMPST
ncbi:hypothetical protein D9M72_439140 [compost metagenome]